jgi:hypothetical protein
MHVYVAYTCMRMISYILFEDRAGIGMFRCRHGMVVKCSFFRLQVLTSPGEIGEERVQVQARGELQLGLLIEGMRRDFFEMEITAPTVLMRMEEGKQLEPLEEAVLEVPAACVGAL